MPDANHCLRPDFAQRLYERLRQGDSINLTGKPGSGCSRALHDVARMAREQGIMALCLDMNAYKHSPRAFQQAVYEQMAQALPPAAELRPLPAGEAPPLYPSQVLALQPMPAGQAFILLDNFHRILDNPQQRFPQRFFDDLNSLKNRPGISLCCVTEQPHLRYRIHTADEGGRITATTSWLDLQVVELPRLSRADIRAELERQLGGLPAWIDETDREALVDGLHGHEHPVALLRLLKTHYEFEAPMPAAQRLYQCLRQYGGQYGARPRPHWFSWTGLLAPLKELSEIWKNFKSR
jgi:hypothetical protein